MKPRVLAGLLACSVACVPMALADESGTSHHHIVKDSVITTKVKSKFAAKHLSLTNIKVDTDAKGVVWLSGRASTQDAVDMAGLIAKDTEGVKSVHNDIAVQP